MDWIDLSHYGFALSMVEVEQDGELLPRRMVMAVQTSPDKPGSAEAPVLLRRAEFTQNAKNPALWAMPETKFSLNRMFRIFGDAQSRDQSRESVVRIIKSPKPAPTPAQTANTTPAPARPVTEPEAVAAPVRQAASVRAPRVSPVVNVEVKPVEAPAAAVMSVAEPVVAPESVMAAVSAPELDATPPVAAPDIQVESPAAEPAPVQVVVPPVLEVEPVGLVEPTPAPEQLEPVLEVPAPETVANESVEAPAPSMVAIEPSAADPIAPVSVIVENELPSEAPAAVEVVAPAILAVETPMVDAPAVVVTSEVAADSLPEVAGDLSAAIAQDTPASIEVAGEFVAPAESDIDQAVAQDSSSGVLEASPQSTLTESDPAVRRDTSFTSLWDNGVRPKVFDVSYSDIKVPEGAALIYSWNDKRESPTAIERTLFELFETPEGQRFLKDASSRFGSSVTEENPDLTKAKRPTLFLRLKPDESNLEEIVANTYVRPALAYETAMRGSDLEKFAEVVFGKDRVSEGMAKINLLIPRVIVEQKFFNTEPGKKQKSLLDIYNTVVEANRFFVHGAAIPLEGASAPLPAKVILQRVAITGKEKDDRISVFGDHTVSFALGDSRRITEIPLDSTAPVTGNAVLDLSQDTKLESEIEIDGFKTTSLQEAQLLSLLAKRVENGRTQALLRRNANEDALINHIACRYSIEGRAIIDPMLAAGDSQAQGFYLFLIGRRRPSVLDEPHEAALRWKNMEGWPSLWSWTSTVVVSSRSKISKYYTDAGVAGADGIDNKAGAQQNYFQVPYASLSRVAEPSTMVPRNMAGSTLHALARVQKDIPDVDAWLSSRLGMTINELGEKLQPEQIDAATMMLHTWSRGYAFLLADQTGIGKGRTLMTGVSTMLNPDPTIEKIKSSDGHEITKILVLTENKTNIGDLFRDIRGLGRLDWFQPAFINGVMDIRDEITNEVIHAGTPVEEVAEWVGARVWPAGVNVVFGTYTQFNKATRGRRNHELNADEARRAAKAMWLEAVVDKNTLLITDEAQNALGLSSATGVNIRAAVAKAGLVAWSSGSHGKDSRSSHLYLRAMPRDVDKDTLIEVLRKGGESMAEVFTSMIAREGTLIRREHDLSRCDYTTFEISQERQDQNRVHMDAMAAILSEIAFVNGDIQERVNAMNVEIANQLLQDNPLFDVNNPALKDKFKSMQIKRQSFGSPLYNLSRIFVASLIVDDAVDKAVAKLREGRKPVFLVENTVENILRGLLDEDLKEPTPCDPPEITLVVRRMIKTMMGWSDAKGKRHSVFENDVVTMTNFVGMRVREVNMRIHDHIQASIGQTGKEAEKAWKSLIQQSYGDEIDRLVSIGYISEDGKKTAMGFVKELARAPIPKTQLDFDILIDTHFPIGGDQQAVSFATALSRIEIMLDALPSLKASFIDSLRMGIEDAGYTCGEISGRKLMYANGMVMPRPAESRTDVRNAFNSGRYDAVIINAAGAVGIDLHAGERFLDQRPRTMIPVQAPADPLILIQAFGRIFRYKQTSRPEVLMPMTGLPIHARFIMMMNAKLGKVSATTTSNREHSARITSVPDLFSSIGDIVCANYFEQRPDLMIRMGLEVRNDEEGNQLVGELGDKAAVAQQQAAEMIAFGEDNDNDRKANAFIGRLIMLTDAEQRQIWDDICAEYDAYIQELDAKGMNPLKSQVIEGKVHLKGITPLSGDFSEMKDDENSNFVSEFTKPVFLQDITIERQVKPVRSDDLEMIVSTGLMRYEVDQVANTVDRLHRMREENLGVWNTTNLPLDMALEQFLTADPPVNNVLTKHASAYDQLRNALTDLLPGKKVTFSMDGVPIFGIVTAIKAPISYYGNSGASRNYTLGSHWDIMIQIPGSAEQQRFTLSSLLSDKEFKIEPGLESDARREVLEAFETSVSASRLEPAQVMTGNLWEAMRLNIRLKLGKLVSWTDDTGSVHRGVLISKRALVNNQLMTMLPTPVSSAVSAHNILSNRKLKIYGSNDLSVTGLTISQRAKGRWVISLPYIGDQSYAELWADHAVLNRLLTLSRRDDDPKAGRVVLSQWLKEEISRPIQKITLTIEDQRQLKEALDLFFKKGIKFFASFKAREFMKEQTIEVIDGDVADEPEVRRQAPNGRRPAVVAQPAPRRGRREPVYEPPNPRAGRMEAAVRAERRPTQEAAPMAAAAPARAHQPAVRPRPPAPILEDQPDDDYGFRIIARPAA